jgi:hypothetical protein
MSRKGAAEPQADRPLLAAKAARPEVWVLLSRADEIIVGSRGHGPYRRRARQHGEAPRGERPLPITVVPARAAERVEGDYS